MSKWFFSKYNKLGFNSEIYFTVENKDTGEFLRFNERDYNFVASNVDPTLLEQFNDDSLNVIDSDDTLKEKEITLDVERIFTDYSNISIKPYFGYSMVYREQ
ncbi:hypothetical protein [Paenibacillus vini]|uniref:hypothetical protein n=1 Tax=Paenibacillus TaxID=44249 RepID=UPI0025B674AF|nr:hypothetical protein [Paenibacillus vini]MDN4070862.1 hypothetical protein [Paenibacillus vini]